MNRFIKCLAEYIWQTIFCFLIFSIDLILFLFSFVFFYFRGSDVDKIGDFYKLHVRVSDGKYTNTALVNIRVETSENSGLVFQKPVYEGSILENSTKISTVTVVNVIGSALNEHIEFRLLNPTEMFTIGLTSGAVVTTGRRFDREQQQNHELIVEARSFEPFRADKPRVAHVIVNVTILDINDNCPMFVNLPYYAIVSVYAERGSLITKVHALDADSYENGEVRYEMKRGHGELFKVDRKTGEVTLKQTLEGHNRDFELLIAAYDGGITPCSTDVTVHVKVNLYFLSCILILNHANKMDNRFLLFHHSFQFHNLLFSVSINVFSLALFSVGTFFFSYFHMWITFRFAFTVFECISLHKSHSHTRVVV